MDVREKLVELLNEVQETGVNEIPAGFGYTSEYVQNEEVASRLIAHGVTVQEWISVDDRLPVNGKEGVLIALRWGEVDIAWCEDGRWRSEFVNEYEDGEVTNWMPLPEPPKVE